MSDSSGGKGLGAACIGLALAVCGYFFANPGNSRSPALKSDPGPPVVPTPPPQTVSPAPLRVSGSAAGVPDRPDLTRLNEAIAKAKSHDDGKTILFPPDQEDGFVRLLRSEIAATGIRAVPVLVEAVKPSSSNLGPAGQVVARAIAESYLDPHGNLGHLKDFLSLCRYDGPYAGLLLYKISERLVTEAEPSKAFQDLMTNGEPENLPPLFYAEGIFRNIGVRMGHRAALELISNPRDGWLGAAAAAALYTSWLSSNPAEASSFIRDLPEGRLRTSGIVHMVRYLADIGDTDDARIWAGTLPPKEAENATQYIDQAKSGDARGVGTSP